MPAQLESDHALDEQTEDLPWAQYGELTNPPKSSLSGLYCGLAGPVLQCQSGADLMLTRAFTIGEMSI